DGIRDWSVTGVQTCALPILLPEPRPPGTFPAAGVSNVPYTPGWPLPATTELLPPIHAHSLVAGLKFQRSFSHPNVLVASTHLPPKSHSLPLLSVQPLAGARPNDATPPRPPGVFARAPLP